MPGSDSDGDEKSSSSSSRTLPLSEAVYGGWLSDTQIILQSKKLFAYVSGLRPFPAAAPTAVLVNGVEIDVSVTAREKAEEKVLVWKEKDDQAKAIIAGLLPRDHLHLFEKAKTSKELWDAIKLKYENNRSGASIATTVIAVANKRWESGSLESHISWFRDTNQMLARFQSTPGVGLVADPSDCYHFPPRILSCLLLNSIPSTGDWGTVKSYHLH